MPMPQMPKDFSFRYVLWFVWCNMVSALAMAQGVLAALTLDPTLMSHDVFHWISLANAVLILVLAQIKRTGPKADGGSDPLVNQQEMKK